MKGTPLSATSSSLLGVQLYVLRYASVTCSRSAKRADPKSLPLVALTALEKAPGRLPVKARPILDERAGMGRAVAVGLGLGVVLTVVGVGLGVSGFGVSFSVVAVLVDAVRAFEVVDLWVVVVVGSCVAGDAGGLGASFVADDDADGFGVFIDSEVVVDTVVVEDVEAGTRDEGWLVER